VKLIASDSSVKVQMANIDDSQTTNDNTVLDAACPTLLEIQKTIGELNRMRPMRLLVS